MTQYVVTVKHPPINIFDKGLTKIRVNAHTEKQAVKEVTKHSMFPKDGTVVKIRIAAYIKK